MQENFLLQATKRRRQLEDSMQSNFKEKMKEKFMNKQIAVDVRKGQKACEQLDSSKVFSLLVNLNIFITEKTAIDNIHVSIRE